MTTPVVWVSYHPPEIIARGYWDQGQLEQIFDHDLWRPVGARSFTHHVNDWPEPDRPIVCVVPARHHAKNRDYVRLNQDLSRYPGVVLVLTGDEAHVFDVDRVKHPNLVLWVMTPDTKREYPPNTVLMVDGPPPHAKAWIKAAGPDKTDDWFFSGQVSHEKRAQCVAQLELLDPGRAISTPGFTQGLGHQEYYSGLAAARVAPAPGGPCTPDTFRAFEALEAGCVPICDSRSEGYWQRMFDQEPPWPILESWEFLPANMAEILEHWPAVVNRCTQYWIAYKRALAYKMQESLALVGASSDPMRRPEDEVTVLVATSPIPSHPDTRVIEETLASVFERLPGAEVILMVDGVRPQQEDRRADYEEYIRRLLWKCNIEWKNVFPILFQEHHHQAAMTRHALGRVETPNILFVEHDTPLVGDIEWVRILDMIEAGHADLVRLHHETHILPDHKHLMLYQGAPHPGFVRTIQWSQRPHVASAAYYARILANHFSEDCLTMIEDTMHGVVQHAFGEHGMNGWHQHRLWLYKPNDVNIKRSTHLDGREGDSKFEMTP